MILTVLGLSWVLCWPRFRGPGGVLGRPRRVWGASWGVSWELLGTFGCLMGPLGRLLGVSWGILGGS